jgi:hypothetical protein
MKLSTLAIWAPHSSMLFGPGDEDQDVTASRQCLSRWRSTAPVYGAGEPGSSWLPPLRAQRYPGTDTDNGTKQQKDRARRTPTLALAMAPYGIGTRRGESPFSP